jgi:drug/metabolite transporter (DMT)-like permease
MNWNYLLYIFSGIITSLPVIVCRQFYSTHNFDIENIMIFLVIIYLIWYIITLLLYYYIKQHVKIGDFYVVIKLLEVGITVFVSIYFFHEKYEISKYIGLFFAFISLILVSI